MDKIDKEILCPDCLERGKHKLLGKNIDAEGKIKLWCNACKEEKVIVLKHNYTLHNFTT